jgi:hypothetical protein
MASVIDAIDKALGEDEIRALCERVYSGRDPASKERFINLVNTGKRSAGLLLAMHSVVLENSTNVVDMDGALKKIGLRLCSGMAKTHGNTERGLTYGFDSETGQRRISSNEGQLFLEKI